MKNLRQERIDRYNNKFKPFVSEGNLFSPMINTIPGNNSVDGNRQQMSRAHQTQGKLLEKPEPPNFKTKYVDSIARSSEYFVRRAAYDGNVHMSNNKLIVEYDESQITDNNLSSLDIINIKPTDIVCKTGKISKGEIFLRDSSMTLKGLAYGKHFKWAPGSLKWTYEDSILITETAAEELTTISYHAEDYLVLKDTFLLNIDVLNSGKINKGDWIIKEFNKGIQVLSIPTNTQFCKEGGEISGIELQEFSDNIKTSKPIKEFINKYSINNELNRLQEDFPQIKDKLNTSFKSLFHKTEDEKLILRIHYKVRKKAKTGDKIVNRFGNKGISSKIIPDEEARQMFLDEWGIDYTPDIVFNPLGVHTRMNPMQLGESVFNYILKVSIPRICREKIKEGQSVNDILNWICDKIHDKMDQKLSDSVRAALNNSSEKIQLKILNDILKNGLVYEINEIIPRILIKIGEIAEDIDPDYYAEHAILGHGIMYTLKLSHEVDHKIKAISTGNYSVKFNTPLDGQKIGEMELWTIAAYDAPATIFSKQKTKADELKSKGYVFNQIVNKGSCKISEVDDGTKSKSLKLVNHLLAVVDINQQKVIAEGSNQ